MTRPFNFSPGPAVVAPEVLEAAAEALRGVPEVGGLSVVEISHRLPWFEQVVADTRDALRRLMAIPDSHAILFVQGGARGQFAQVPLNWLRPGTCAAYVDTGVWSRGAVVDAKTLGDVRVVASGEADGYRVLPDLSGVVLPAETVYAHTTSNNTIYGTQWPEMPDFGEVAHISDMSSDILSREIDVSRFKLIYGGAQKNAGISGVTIVIIDKAWMAAARDDIPTIWQYRVLDANDSMYNTPPTFAIYVTLLVCRWLEALGGVPAIAARNEDKARLVYEAIDRSDGFYRGVADARHRSRMNATFRLRDEALEKAFVAEAEAAGLHGLKGHRKAGGIRASLYNALPVEAAARLAELMESFRARH